MWFLIALTILVDYFVQYGELVDCVIMRNPETGKSRGFGFVTYKENSSLDKIFEPGSTHELDGRRLDIKRAVPREETAKEEPKKQPDNRKTKKIFVGGLSAETTKEAMEAHFSQYGEMSDVCVMVDRDSGRPRGFGFVTFVNEESVDRLMDETHEISGKTVRPLISIS